jgi:uncharacterized protein YqgC (DUF456 family)
LSAFSQFFQNLANSAGMLAFFAVQIMGLFIIPFGLPGTWLQVISALALLIISHGARMTWPYIGLFVLLATIGEMIEFLSGQWGAKKFGGSKGAAWGALIGGFFGAFFGGALIPIPIVGSLIASFLGTFIGAIIGEMRVQQSREANLRVGFGAVLGRAIGMAAKMFCAFVIAIVATVVAVF